MMGKNVLVLGSGGREHAFVWSILKDPQVSKVYCAPGNAGTSDIAINLELSLNNNHEILKIINDNSIDYVIVGPEGPLDNGIVDFLQEHKIKVFGPSKFASQLESSKLFARNFMKNNNIPQPEFYECSSSEQVQSIIDNKGLPIVLKADGLAAGKGVIICHNHDELNDALSDMFDDKKFGDAANKISLEQCLIGEELSVFVMCDGENYKILNSAQDHKRVFDQDKGPNTGGMGAYSPTPLYTQDLKEKIEDRIIKPTIKGMIDKGHPFVGFLYIGLMLVDNEPYVIEFNVRMGDPETQVVLPLLNSSLFELIKLAINKNLDIANVENKEGYAVTVVLSADGYPNTYQKGMKIKGIESVEKDSILFHSGTRYSNEGLVSNGGRILNVVAMDSTLKGAINKAYKSVEKISFEKKYYRTDIGQKGLKYLTIKDENK